MYRGARFVVLAFGALFARSVFAVESTNDGSWTGPGCAAVSQAMATCQSSQYAIDPRVCEISGHKKDDQTFIVGLWDYPNRGGANWGAWSGTCAGTAIAPSPNKPNGALPPGNSVGDPIDAGSGNAYRHDKDFTDGRWLTFDRYYNSNPSTGLDTLGEHWRHTYAQLLSYVAGTANAPATATITREDGRVSIYSQLNGVWWAESDIADTLAEQSDVNGNPTGWTLQRVDTRSTEQFDAMGHLISIHSQEGFTTTLTYSTNSTPTSVAPGPGYLILVTDPSQRTIQLTYNSSGWINRVTAPDGSNYSYSYNAAGDLSTVTYPDAKTLTYLYNESSNSAGANTVGLLTGVVDESNTRYTSYSYNASSQATNSQFAGGVFSNTLTYNSDGSVDVLDPLNTSRHRSFTVVQGVPLATGVNGICESCSIAGSWSYDFNGLLDQATDFNGNVTTYQYDAQRMESQRVEGSGSSTPRPVQTDWNDTLHVPTERRWLDYNYNVVTKTDWVYNARGQALAECRIDMSVSAAAAYTCAATGTPPAGVRRSTYTYCDAVGSGCPLIGLRLSSTGPRTDLTQTTTYSYYTSSSTTNCGTPGGACYQAGDVYQITDALGHVTNYASYDGAGRVTRLTDPNGVNTDMTYTPRGWLASRSVGGSTTTFTYMPYGEVQTITDPDGVVTTFGYDSAHRLTDITDAQGNDLHYTLDAAGNKTAEQISTATGTVVHSLSRSYNALGQLTAVIDGLNQTVFNAGYSDSYDANGNLTHSADGLSIQRQQTYDALNRLKSTLDNYNGTDTATANTTTTTSQDALDRVASVTDPSGLVTNYTHDGLGNLTTLQSPDSGTSTTTFDAAGNALTHTDAKGTVATSTYDALDRKTRTTYTDTTANVTYTYDEANSVTGCAASAPIGRLTRMVEQAVSTTYCYDARGNVIQKTQVVSGTTDSTSYRYTAADRLSGETAPDGTAISYAFDSDGRISGVQVTPSGSTGASSAVVSNVTYLPFGPINGYTLGNGQTVTRAYDANYRLTDLTSPALALHFARDAMGDITALGNAPGANPATESYQYDPLYRLTGVSNSSGVLESYTYNPTGDRLSKTASGLATGAYSYTSGTHQLASIGNAPRANDANGNTTGSVIGGSTYGFAYDPRQRIALAQANGTTVGTYLYNALGQRVYTSASNLRFNYDQAGHVLANYGASSRDYIWLDDLPVATVDNTNSGSVTSSTVNYVVADQLATPRAVTNSAGTVVWSWAYAGNPFGEQQPISTGYALNLRYPGQYHDVETGLDYNGARYYDSGIGRFPQSDPKGLFGGQISTYAYGNNNPLSNIDPTGMDDTQCMFNRASCGWPQSVSTDSNASVGVSETGAAAIGVETTGWGIAVDSTPNICFYGSVAGTVGTAAGVYKGAGIDASLGTGALSDGDSETAVAGFDGGEGTAAGGTIQYDPINHQVSAAKGFLGAGEGAWAGILRNKTHYYCVRKPQPKPTCPGKP